MWHKARTDDRDIEVVEMESFLSSMHPALAVLSCGAALPSIELIESCARKEIPFITIGQANSENWWLEDDLAERYRLVLPAALRCYFVSRANLELAEKQIGCPLPNAEVVRNPFNVDFNASVPWPQDCQDEVRFACVGRLDPRAKGQDILLEALASPEWVNRSWRLKFYGDGPMKAVIERLVERFNLGDRVTLAGYISPVEQIWAENHVLILPSRLEGLPLAIVEAMLCARPVIATDVAGNSEILEDGVTGFLADAPNVTGLTKALERFWERRTELRKIGQAAATSIRNSIPSDPTIVFAEKLKYLLSKKINV